MMMSNALTHSIRRRLTGRRRRQQQQQLQLRDLPPAEIAQELPLPSASAPPANENSGGRVKRQMDRLRRSIRASFRRAGRKGHGNDASALQTASSGGADAGQNGHAGSSSSNGFQQPDEASVRAGLCSFPVKYLGAIEVPEMRGIEICESALKVLRGQRRKPVKAILYVSGDGLRVVDNDSNRGLIVDQTIEKVSFCAPDRHHDKSFAYICREGTTRRWMCHGFLAHKDTGERLSHAVGCAFAICLERKNNREHEAKEMAKNALKPNWDSPAPRVASAVASSSIAMGPPGSQRTNLAYASFRHDVSLGERQRDPQMAIRYEPPPINEIAARATAAAAKPRPLSNPALFERQGSLRAPDNSTANGFRRQQQNYTSLRPSVTTSALDQVATLKPWQTAAAARASMLTKEAIIEEEDEFSTPYQNLTRAAPVPSSISYPEGLVGQQQQQPLHQAPLPNSWMPRVAPDDWLADVLRSARELSVSSTLSAPPVEPPPPLPPQQSASLSQLPPLASPSSVLDAFGQTSWAPAEAPISLTLLTPTPAVVAPRQTAVTQAQEEEDPFDVSWTSNAMASTAAAATTNPFTATAAT